MTGRLELAAALERTRSWLERRGALLSRRLPPPPFLAALSQVESEIGADLRARHADDIARAQRDLLASLGPAGDAPPRTDAIETLSERLVSELRARMECVPWDRPLLGAVARFDQALPTDAGELMDDQRLDASVRRELVRVLDVQTRRAGDYLVLADLVDPLYPVDPRLRTSLLDIASGPGGFAIAVARAARGRRAVEVVASDADDGYLDLGRARAETAGVSDLVAFRRIDAFDLERELGAFRPDIVTCTRSLHHFGVRGSARLLAQALRHAVRGVMFVDIGRSISRMLMAAGAGIGSGNWRFAYDAVISVRKAFTPEELRLVLACIPGTEHLEIFFTPPAYVVVRGAARGPIRLAEDGRAAR